jgi:hypothetical protein
MANGNIGEPLRSVAVANTVNYVYGIGCSEVVKGSSPIWVYFIARFNKTTGINDIAQDFVTSGSSTFLDYRTRVKLDSSDNIYMFFTENYVGNELIHVAQLDTNLNYIQGNLL